MDEQDNSNAQLPTDLGLQGQDPASAPETVEGTQHQGFQRRIDELTAERRAAERQRDEMVAANTRLAQQMAEFQAMQLETQRQAAAPQMPDIDPEQRKVLDAYYGAKERELRNLLAQANATAEQTRFDMLASGEDPAVAARARELLPAVRAKGLPIEDAFNFAAGELARQARGGGAPAPQPRNAGGQYTTLTQTGAPPPIRTPGAAPLPPNFERLPLQKQLEILEKRGVGDLPL